ncbi:uncharacterized protein LOC114522684 isoform X2 [Dendronephthya gigantea]|uniref:uncharacterized protein LOC114522684 isoform X2 n=1 Tax=Dendronephthya gigantea TaxID=151771 RepID=UPI00106CEDD5|nr:uncharacterized protein LOC114522684 isoform X2 [Dendronephthya gigantea]
MLTEVEDVVDRSEGFDVEFWSSLFDNIPQRFEEEEKMWKGLGNLLFEKSIDDEPDEPIGTARWLSTFCGCNIWQPDNYGLSGLEKFSDFTPMGPTKSFKKRKNSKDLKKARKRIARSCYGLECLDVAAGDWMNRLQKSRYSLRSNEKRKKTLAEAREKLKALLDDMEDKPEATDYNRTNSSKNEVFGQKSCTEPEADGDVLQSEPKSSYSLRSNVKGKNALKEAKGKSRYSLRSSEKRKTLTEAKGMNHYSLQPETGEKRKYPDDEKHNGQNIQSIENGPLHNRWESSLTSARKRDKKKSFLPESGASGSSSNCSTVEPEPALESESESESSDESDVQDCYYPFDKLAKDLKRNSKTERYKNLVNSCISESVGWEKNQAVLDSL